MSQKSYTSYVIVTGGSSGVGLECARELAAAQPDTLVVIASRTAPPGPLPSNTEFRSLDLGSLDSVRDFVAWWPYAPVSSLTLCAGVIMFSLKLNPDGIEETFAINHIGHAALFFGLKKRDLLAPDARITFVSSSLHNPENKSRTRPAWTTTDDVAHARTPEQQAPRTAYANSKLANVAFANTLARRAKAAESGWSFNTYDPGFIPGSRLARDAPFPLRMVAYYVLPNISWMLSYAGMKMSTLQRSGRALAEMAYGPKYAGMRGGFVHIDHETRSSDLSHDEAFQDELWDWTAQYLKLEPEALKL